MLNTGPKYNGEPTPHALANGLATLGRYGDSYMVHAAEGEAIIPREILEANPGLKEDLFRQMRMMGIRNPNRYVVGSGFNSINPITGQPEFFFKKIFRAVKKVFKKALPFIAPILGNILLPGIGGLIASGLATKLQGGSWGDVLKSVGTAWVGGSLMKGIGGLGGNGGWDKAFGEFSKGMTNPLQAGADLLSGAPSSPWEQGILRHGKLEDWSALGGMEYKPDFKPPTDAAAILNTGVQTEPSTLASWMDEPPIAAGVQPPSVDYGDVPSQRTPPLVPRSGETLLTERQLRGAGIDTERSLEQAISQSPEGVGFIRESTDAPFSPSVSTLSSKEGLGNPNDYSPGYQKTLNDITYEATVSVNKNTGVKSNQWKPLEPTFVQKITDPTGKGAGLYGKAAATLGPTAYSYWRAWKDQRGDKGLPESATSKQQAAYAKFLALPDDQKRSPRGRELLIESGIVPGASREQIARTAGITGTQASDYLKSKYRTAAEGGLASFLQGGGEVIGPGTAKSDSIPARLSNGEFVMTEAAVRGAGGGNRDMGAARMYDLMSRFEGAVA